MFNFKLIIEQGQEKARPCLDCSGFKVKDLGGVAPLKDAVYCGDGRLDVGSNVEQMLKNTFGYIFGFDADNCLLIYRDRLGTIPLFIFDDRDNRRLILFNRFYLVKTYWTKFIIDQVGFWETLLFESTLGSRSIFKNVVQVPCSSVVRIRPDLRFEIKRYWYVDYEIDHSLGKEQFFKQSYEKFDTVFAHFKTQNKCLLPISGGEDSRLMACFMSKHIQPEMLNSVTYGYDKRLLEYRYAKQVMSVLGFKEPVFHELGHDSYIRNLNSMAEITGGCISIQNTHLFDYLSHSKDLKGIDTILSSACSDGILGFDASLSDTQSTSMEDCAYLNTLKKWCNVLMIPADACEAIEADLQQLYFEWKQNSSISTIDEYIYIVERNSKFHLFLADMARDFGDVFLPFTESTLVDFYLSLPNKYRFRKLGTIEMLKKYFPEMRNIKSIGSLFGKEGFCRPIQYGYFRLVNFLNFIAACMTNDAVHFLNPYQTENHGYNLRKHYRPMLGRSFELLVDANVLDGRLKSFVNKIPTRGAYNYALRYQMINAAYVFELMREQAVGAKVDT